MTKVNRNNENETKSGITYFFLKKKKIKVFQKRSKSKFLRFMTKVNPEKGNETKSDI